MRPAKPWPGGPDAVWAASAGTSAQHRPPAPDVSGFDDFARRVAPREAALLSALLFVFLGVGLLVYAIVVASLMPELPEGLDGFDAVVLNLMKWHWVVSLVVGAWSLLVTAPRTYLKDKRDHPGETRALYEASLDRGVVCEVFATRFKVPGSDGWDRTVIGIDARLDGERAARIRRAFTDWFAAVQSDVRTDKEVSKRHGGRDVLPAEDVFGPEAAGGYLIRQSVVGTGWMMLIRDDPVARREWTRLRIEEAKAA
ncbi:hypothetical protein [Glycomyces tenuis]|uniref:hypothetical protein n=1 Tax=Glycomyces tenuis TaxID=58116 RepID=UPI00047B7FE2|nr:hypothetical protein [Glycomyces tenuis]